MDPEAIFHWSIWVIAVAILSGVLVVMRREEVARTPARVMAAGIAIFAGIMSVIAVRQYMTGLWPGECSVGNHLTAWRETPSGQFVQEPVSRAEAHR